MRTFLISSIGALFLPSLAGAQTVYVVDSDPLLGDFSNIQTAVDAAGSGDTILIRDSGANAWGEFSINGKSLFLIGDEEFEVDISAGCRVTNVPLGGQVTMTGLKFLTLPGSAPGLEIGDCDGAVSLQDCSVSPFTSTFPLQNLNALLVRDSEQVVLTDCRIFGNNVPPGVNDGSTGGSGLTAIDSTLFVYDSLLTGGRGAFGEWVSFTTATDGGNGGNALVATNSFVLLEGTTLEGGDGGFGLGAEGLFVCAAGGSGGAAIASLDSQVLLRDSPATGGTAGAINGGSGTCTTGTPGPVWNGTGAAPQFLAGAAKSYLFEPNPFREGEIATATHVGDPGDATFVLLGFGSAALYSPAHLGALLVNAPLSVIPSLPIGPSGSLQFPVAVEELGPGIEGVSFSVQLVTFNALEGFRFGSRQVVTVLDRSF